MVYCPECGAENEEEATYCTKCRSPLKEGARRQYYPWERKEKEEKNEKEEKSEKEEKQEKEENEEKYEKGEYQQSWIAFVGLLIILAGVISLMEAWYGYAWDQLWPLPIIAIGLFLILIGLRARQRSPRP